MPRNKNNNIGARAARVTVVRPEPRGATGNGDRGLIIGLQTNRKNSASSDMSQFDHCNVRDVKVYLNSTYFPYESLNVNFANNRIALLYEQ